MGSIERAKRFLYKPPHHDEDGERETHTIDPKNYQHRTLPLHNSEKPTKPIRLTVSIIMERLLELEMEVARLNARLESVSASVQTCQLEEYIKLNTPSPPGDDRPTDWLEA